MSPFATQLTTILICAVGALMGSFALLSGIFTVYHARRVLLGTRGFEEKYREDMQLGILLILAGTFILVASVWR